MAVRPIPASASLITPPRLRDGPGVLSGAAARAGKGNGRDRLDRALARAGGAVRLPQTEALDRWEQLDALGREPELLEAPAEAAVPVAREAVGGEGVTPGWASPDGP